MVHAVDLGCSTTQPGEAGEGKKGKVNPSVRHKEERRHVKVVERKRYKASKSKMNLYELCLQKLLLNELHTHILCWTSIYCLWQEMRKEKGGSFCIGVCMSGCSDQFNSRRCEVNDNLFCKSAPDSCSGRLAHSAMSPHLLAKCAAG